MRIVAKIEVDAIEYDENEILRKAVEAELNHKLTMELINYLEYDIPYGIKKSEKTHIEGRPYGKIYILEKTIVTDILD